MKSLDLPNMENNNDSNFPKVDKISPKCKGSESLSIFTFVKIFSLGCMEQMKFKIVLLLRNVDSVKVGWSPT